MEPEVTPKPEGSERQQQAPAIPPVATPPVDETAVRNAATIAERTRSAAITNCVKIANLPDTFAKGLIDGGVTLDAARAKVFEELERNQVTINSNNTSVGNEAEVRATRVKGLQAAVGIKIIGFTPELRATAGEFYGLTIHELARECAELSGVNTRGMSRPQVAKIALNQERGFGMHTTSDFPNILGINFRTKLRKDYDLQPRTFQAWASRTTLPDFRENRSAQIGGISTFEEVLQGGEYKRKTMEEAVEAYRLKKYGAIVGVSWELLINDDLGAFNKTAKNFANAAAQTQSDLMYEVLTGNPLMGDGFALFSTQHKNLAATGTVIDDVNIGKAREAMRKQVSLEKSVLNIVPRFLIVGPTQEQNALRYTNPNFVPVNANNINIYASSLVVIVDARITDNAWYLAADPASIDTVEYAFLEGEEELFTEERAAFDQDAYEYKARMVFGRKALDYRGLYKNPGALPA